MGIIVNAIEKAVYPGIDVKLALDVAATEIYDKNTGFIICRKGVKKTSGMVQYYEMLCRNIR